MRLIYLYINTTPGKGKIIKTEKSRTHPLQTRPLRAPTTTSLITAIAFLRPRLSASSVKWYINIFICILKFYFRFPPYFIITAVFNWIRKFVFADIVWISLFFTLAYCFTSEWKLNPKEYPLYIFITRANSAIQDSNIYFLGNADSLIEVIYHFIIVLSLNS